MGSDSYYTDAVRSFSSAGDINGDGFDDIVLGVPFAYTSSGYAAGQTFVLFGTDAGFPQSVSLSDLDGTNGFLLGGSEQAEFSGFAVSGAGDVNGDGIDDLIIGAPNNDSAAYYAGQSYVVFGSDSGFSSSLDLSNLDGTNGFAVSGIDSYDNSGRSVSSAGDFNGDGFDDIIILAADAAPGGVYYADEAYIVFGTDQGFSATISAASLDGTNGLVINGTSTGEDYYNPPSVTSAGDINGDGFDDIIIADPYSSTSGYAEFDRAGEAFVVFGGASGTPSSIDLASLDGTNGFTFRGEGSYDFVGRSISAAGDINGDGLDDIIIGSRSGLTIAYDDNTTLYTNNGKSYVIFGTTSGFPATLTEASLDGTNGFTIVGTGYYDEAGASVSGGGDINGDGFDDLIIGAPGVRPPSNPDAYAQYGATYVVFGSASGFGATLDLSTIDGTTNGFVINTDQAYSQLGELVAAAGDLNGDGFDDIIVGRDTYYIDETFVVFGFSTGPTNSAPDAVDDVVSTDEDVAVRIAVLANDTDADQDTLSITAVGTAANGTVLIGDNGTSDDLSDDLILYTPDADFFGTDTFTYSITDGEETDTATVTVNIISDGLNLVAGTSGNDRLVGSDGNDELKGNGGTDLLIGLDGDDVYLIDSTGDRVREAFGEGTDLVQSSVNFRLTLGVENLEALGLDDINLTGNLLSNAITGNDGDNRILGRVGDDTLNGLGGNDLIKGGLGDDIISGGSGNDTLRGGRGKDIFAYGEGDGDDQILDFKAGVDKIDLTGLANSGITSFEDLEFTSQGFNGQTTVIEFGALEGSITLIDVRENKLDADDFLFEPPDPVA